MQAFNFKFEKSSFSPKREKRSIQSLHQLLSNGNQVYNSLRVFSKSFFPLSIVFLLCLLCLFKGIVYWLFCTLFFSYCIWVFEFWRGSKFWLDWSEPWIELLRIGLYLKNKWSCFNSKGRRCPMYYILEIYLVDWIFK